MRAFLYFWLFVLLATTVTQGATVPLVEFMRDEFNIVQLVTMPEVIPFELIIFGRGDTESIRWVSDAHFEPVTPQGERPWLVGLALAPQSTFAPPEIVSVINAAWQGRVLNTVAMRILGQQAPSLVNGEFLVSQPENYRITEIERIVSDLHVLEMIVSGGRWYFGVFGPRSAPRGISRNGYSRAGDLAVVGCLVNA